MSSTVADTGAPLSVIIQAERDAARTFGLAAGLLIGGASQAEGALRSLDDGIGLIEQAAREGASAASVSLASGDRASARSNAPDLARRDVSVRQGCHLLAHRTNKACLLHYRNIQQHECLRAELRRFRMRLEKPFNHTLNIGRDVIVIHYSCDGVVHAAHLSPEVRNRDKSLVSLLRHSDRKLYIFAGSFKLHDSFLEAVRRFHQLFYTLALLHCIRRCAPSDEEWHPSEFGEQCANLHMLYDLLYGIMVHGNCFASQILKSQQSSFKTVKIRYGNLLTAECNCLRCRLPCEASCTNGDQRSNQGLIAVEPKFEARWLRRLFAAQHRCWDGTNIRLGVEPQSCKRDCSDRNVEARLQRAIRPLIHRAPPRLHRARNSARSRASVRMPVHARLHAADMPLFTVATE
ncbi:hypothetical protein CJNNKLLH_0981 [Methylorubrum thiocyanatum]|nr:hypothetical protein CJNNKLLH_0981 [Methylorubrum thiocyanatum]